MPGVLLAGITFCGRFGGGGEGPTGVACRVIAGPATGSPTGAPSAWPQERQNFARGATGAEHRGHIDVVRGEAIYDSCLEVDAPDPGLGSRSSGVRHHVLLHWLHDGIVFPLLNSVSGS